MPIKIPNKICFSLAFDELGRFSGLTYTNITVNKTLTQKRSKLSSMAVQLELYKCIFNRSTKQNDPNDEIIKLFSKRIIHIFIQRVSSIHEAGIYLELCCVYMNLNQQMILVSL